MLLATIVGAVSAIVDIGALILILILKIYKR